MQAYVAPEDEKFIACDHSHCEKEWYVVTTPLRYYFSISYPMQRLPQVPAF